MSIWKMSSSANQPVWVGISPASTSPRTQRKPRPARCEQVLDRSAGDEVGAERTNVELDRADGLVAVGEHERAVRVGGLGDRGDVVPVACPVGDRRAADERRALVDRCCELLGRDRAVGLGPHVHDLRPAQLLRVGDLADRRKLVVADHDPVPPAALERERRDDPADALRDRRRDRDLVGLDRGAARRTRPAPPRRARPRTPTRRRSRPSPRGTPRRRRARDARARPASTS